MHNTPDVREHTAIFNLDIYRYDNLTILLSLRAVVQSTQLSGLLLRPMPIHCGEVTSSLLRNATDHLPAHCAGVIQLLLKAET